MDNFSKKLALVIMGICGFVLLLSLIRRTGIMTPLMFAVALAAAIPEALMTYYYNLFRQWEQAEWQKKMQ